MLEFSPTTATMLGDHRFDDRIEDISAEAEQRMVQTWKQLRHEVEAVGREDDLRPADRLTRTLLLADLDRAVTELEWRPAEMSAGHIDGVHVRLLTATSQITAPQPSDVTALSRRYSKIGDLLDSAVHRFRDGLAAGRTPVQVTIERSINQLDSYLATPLSTDAFTTVAGPAWHQQFSEITQEVIRPAFQRYRDLLATELLPNRQTRGESRLVLARRRRSRNLCTPDSLPYHHARPRPRRNPPTGADRTRPPPR
ncbi:DUF885 family protein [Nocardia carnea]|uniref:DUF885 family protein n=1 Tax=Nocardia carnea TaxID=37328 RepID=UPI002454C2C9|nr:DUF885 family protein [Nocardia carnea]